MSAVEVIGAPVGLRAGGHLEVKPHRVVSTRLFWSELKLIIGRRRNQAGVVVLAAVPVLIAIALKLAGNDEGGGGPAFFGDITDNGLFVALAALTVELPLFLPLAVSAIAGDAVAGEANQGTLRYLLTVPVSRTRLLVVKFASIVVACFAATLIVAASGLAIGFVLFPVGDVTLLSGTQVSLATGIGRLLMICAYLAICLVALGAIGLFISTLTEQPIGAIVGLATLTITSQILGNLTQLSWLHPYLFTNYWLAFGDLLRDPMAFDLVGRGLISAGVYTAIFGTLAWARFNSRDISS
jgi:ABC-2 type transport system permease protein